MNFREELAKELELGAIAEASMLDEYVKACEAIAVRYHESEVKKLHIQNVSNRTWIVGIKCNGENYDIKVTAPNELAAKMTASSRFMKQRFEFTGCERKDTKRLERN